MTSQNLSTPLASPRLSPSAPSALDHLCARLGIPRPLFWGFVGLLIFMIGDGVELGYLAPYLGQNNIAASDIAVLFTVYGVTVAIGSWCAGALSNIWGPRRVMWLGAAIWVVFEILFLSLGVGQLSYPMMIVGYALRGFGYPLFAYGFLVWIVAATPARKLGVAMGWFWVAYAAGLPTLGALVASVTVPLIGALATFWLSLVLVIVGALLALLCVHDAAGSTRLAPVGEKPLTSLIGSIAILWTEPKTSLGAVVRTINTASMFGFFVILPGFFMDVVGFTLEQWLRLVTVIFVSNIAGNLISSRLANRLGLRNTVIWMGAVGSAISTPLFFYVPQLFPGDFAVACAMGALYGMTLGGFVPLSALMPLLVPKNRAAAVSVLSLGAGASTWVGPAIVAIFSASLGLAGIIWIFAGLYALSAALMIPLRDPPELKGKAMPAPAHGASVARA
ncbi:MFS transporter [Massilia sp. S19_KUP03_FR1]|uniref:MFS transporter n=1 Tax=Massilia sp. S19_KUP03_FR1 TaxID=3025503 RepID=UPI002FCD7BBA